MSLTFTDVCNVVSDAKKTVNRGDEIVCRVSRLAVGRLQAANVPCSVLEALKRELKDYNIHTRCWKDE